jgi:hypothetical protein
MYSLPTPNVPERGQEECTVTLKPLKGIGSTIVHELFIYSRLPLPRL